MGEIGDLYVLPDMRRQGVATALIRAAEARCAELGCSALPVVVTPESQARHDLLGFYSARLHPRWAHHPDPLLALRCAHGGPAWVVCDVDGIALAGHQIVPAASCRSVS